LNAVMLYISTHSGLNVVFHDINKISFPDVKYTY